MEVGERCFHSRTIRGGLLVPGGVEGGHARGTALRRVPRPWGGISRHVAGAAEDEIQLPRVFLSAPEILE